MFKNNVKSGVVKNEQRRSRLVAQAATAGASGGNRTQFESESRRRSAADLPEPGPASLASVAAGATGPAS